jgi:hypothetical protein
MLVSEIVDPPGIPVLRSVPPPAHTVALLVDVLKVE